MSEEGAAPDRERGWWGPILALVAITFLSAQGAVRILLPVPEVMVLLAPLTAACAVAGWGAGGRFTLTAIWTAFAAWVLFRSPAVGGAPLALMRGWAILLAVCFAIVLSIPKVEGFLAKALLALVGAAALGVAGLAGVDGGVREAWQVVVGSVGERATLANREWQYLTGTAEWIALAERSPQWKDLADQWGEQLARIPSLALRLFPALLGLQSLAVMALGWAVYHRVGRARLGPPLPRLREARFHDALAWGPVAGLLLLALPLSGAADAVAVNLLLFFGALYAVRGLGVLVWFLDPGRMMAVALTLLALLFLPVVMMVAAGLGLGDTWFDWRRTERHRSQRSE